MSTDTPSRGKWATTKLDEGARLVAGGLDAPEGLDGGNYVRPSVFADVDNSMRIANDSPAALKAIRARRWPDATPPVELI
ncbi:aldehyde dehydrogenase family protein [Dactylosporangium sp. NPDC005572]|uniref:aldehyde dehydrogenase family protein n=1 Tax=Dactylosporangium sp. NPDC005572 TaxID=3156889 RepID=UPI0033AF5B2B